MKFHICIALLVVAGAGPLARAQSGRTETGDGKNVTFGEPARFYNLEDQVKNAAEAIAQAQQLIQQEQWYQARRQLDRVRGQQTQSQARAVRQLYLQIDKQGQLQLKQAHATFNQGKYAQGLKMYRQILTTFGWLPAGVAARDAISRARRDPLVAAAMGDEKANTLIETLDKRIDAAFRAAAGRANESSGETPEPSEEPIDRTVKIRRLGDQMLLEVIRTMRRVARSYPDTPTGLEVASQLEALGEDQAFARRLGQIERTAEAEELLKMARMYAAAGREDLARKRYLELVEKYQGTDQADQAARQLGRLGTD